MVKKPINVYHHSIDWIYSCADIFCESNVNFFETSKFSRNVTLMLVLVNRPKTNDYIIS